MRKLLSFLFVSAMVVTGFSQTLSLARLGETFRPTNLVVHWEVSTNTLPHAVWIYRVLPRTFPSAAISNLLTRSGFSEKDKKVPKEALIYKNADRFPSKQLIISSGSIFYNTVSHYSPTNLATGVPEMSE